jgi:hypothetical protein
MTITVFAIGYYGLFLLLLMRLLLLLYLANDYDILFLLFKD